MNGLAYNVKSSLAQTTELGIPSVPRVKLFYKCKHIYHPCTYISAEIMAVFMLETLKSTSVFNIQTIKKIDTFNV